MKIKIIHRKKNKTRKRMLRHKYNIYINIKMIGNGGNLKERENASPKATRRVSSHAFFFINFVQTRDKEIKPR